MIKAIDELLKQWAAELHPPEREEPIECGGGGTLISMLMATKGELIRSTYGPTCPWDRTGDIELIVNKHLPVELVRIIQVHYTDYDRCDSMKWQACGCGRSQYYTRLHEAHTAIAGLLLQRKVA